MAKNQNQPAVNLAAAEPTKIETINGEKLEAKVIAPSAEPTSDKLVELRAKKLEFKKLARTFEPDSVDEENALMEAYKTEQLIKAEIANIKSIEAKQLLDVARNERVKLFDDAIAALLVTGYNPFEAMTPEQKTTYDAAREIVVNELLAKYATSKPAAAKSAGTAKSADGASRDEIVTAHIANIAAGMDDSASRKSLEAAGHKRSTVWHAVNNYNKAK